MVKQKKNMEKLGENKMVRYEDKRGGMIKFANFFLNVFLWAFLVI